MRRPGNSIARARSESGVALPLALLLFLICALLASVVLSATTAVGGRHAQLAKMDQNYYSVMSAADLMKHQLEDQVVFIKAVRTSTEKVTATYRDDGSVDEEAKPEGTPTTTTYYVATLSRKDAESGSRPEESAYKRLGTTSPIDETELKARTFAEQTAIAALFGSNPASLTDEGDGENKGAWQKLEDGLTASVSSAYTMEHAVSDAPSTIDETSMASVLKVDIAQKIDYGVLVATLKPATAAASDANSAYAVTLECVGDAFVDEATEEEITASTASETSRTDTLKITTTREVSVAWTPTGLYKDEAGVA